MSVSFDTSLSRRSLLSLSAIAAASALVGCAGGVALTDLC